MIFGFMQSARAMATRCCCPPESWPGILLRLLRDADALEVFHRQLLRLPLRHAADPDGREGAVLQDREVGEQVEALEHHADLAADGVQARRSSDSSMSSTTICLPGAAPAG
jgi:hypothetical protein